MISLQTNLSSIITQNNLNLSTSKLNQAIERMSTGYKINHAGDNAASYSIATNMSTQISACDIAADNIAMGMDLVNVAQDTISGMQDRASRIHALITQARNGTYGATSLTAMTQEAQAIASEISRLYNNTEYNGIKLFEIPLPEWAKTVQASAGVNAGTTEDVVQAQNGGFIAEVVEDTPQVTVTDPTQLASAISGNTKIGIGNAETLAKLAELVNSGTSCSGKTIILTEDIDLSAYQEGEGWTPIGNSYSKQFQGTFNGNGHKVTGLYIKRTGTDYQGLFGYAGGEIKNIGIEGANVTGGTNTGGLAGWAEGAITNSYATGNVSGSNNTGGLAGLANGAITNSYATGNVSGTDWVGGLVGEIDVYPGDTLSLNNILSSGKVTGENIVGSLIGGVYNTDDGSEFGELNITNASARSQVNMIGFEGDWEGNPYESGQMEGWLNNISGLKMETTFQVGTYGEGDSQISVETNMNLNLRINNLTSDSTFENINSFLSQLSEKATTLGAAQNRLESALESNLVKMDNLMSSLSTIRDADIGKVSSDYIRQQILQQACATLMSTANQSPSIALQLL